MLNLLLNNLCNLQQLQNIYVPNYHLVCTGTKTIFCPNCLAIFIPRLPLILTTQIHPKHITLKFRGFNHFKSHSQLILLCTSPYPAIFMYRLLINLANW